MRAVSACINQPAPRRVLPRLMHCLPKAVQLSRSDFYLPAALTLALDGRCAHKYCYSQRLNWVVYEQASGIERPPGTHIIP
jgi:hypothetical protein